MPFSSYSRRRFLQVAGGCSAHLSLMAAPFPLSARSRWSQKTQGRVVAQESFGRLEAVGDGLWAFISTPLDGDYLTVCNGGIIRGTHGVLVVEAFQTNEGAGWIAEQARSLAGRWPTHVLITHYHGDHSSGLPGFSTSASGSDEPSPTRETPLFHTTSTTRALKAEGFSGDTDPVLRSLWADVVLTPGDEASVLDLGSRQVTLEPRRGHTPSDLTVELPEERAMWCGDLVWNGMFPNYMDAIPSRLSRAVRALAAGPHQLFVPGHGPLADQEDLGLYLAVIDGLEETARTARREGWTPEEAAARHRIPPELGEWTLFNPSYFQRAIEAWMREWS